MQFFAFEGCEAPAAACHHRTGNDDIPIEKTKARKDMGLIAYDASRPRAILSSLKRRGTPFSS